MLLSLNTGFWHSQEVEDEQGGCDVCPEETEISVTSPHPHPGTKGGWSCLMPGSPFAPLTHGFIFNSFIEMQFT